MSDVNKNIGGEPYYQIIKTFRHAPEHKIYYEYAKTCYHTDNLSEARGVLEKLIKTLNLDWRTVYRSYYLLALISVEQGKLSQAKQFNNLALRTFKNYFPAQEFKKKIASLGHYHIGISKYYTCIIDIQYSYS